MHTTTRLGLDVVDGGDAVSNYPTANAQAMGVLDNAVTFTSGTLVSRPVASIQGRYYLATDDTSSGSSIGTLYFDTGAAWVSGFNPPSRGASNIATSESRTNVAYGTLATPDQVTGIVLPTNGLIRVWYQATWQESVNGAARAAIFLNANQLRTVYAASTPNVVQEAKVDSVGAAANRPLNSFAGGLNPDSTLQFTPTDKPETGPVTTGQVVGGGTISGTGTNLVQGGACDIFAAAGTYTVSVQFKASSGSVTAATRKLWVQALSFS